MPSRHRSMHSRRLHTNIADFIYRCVKENTEGQTLDVFAAQECDAERHRIHAHEERWARSVLRRTC